MLILRASKCIKTNGQVYNLGGGYKHKISVIGLINILENKFNMKIKCKFLKERKGDQKVFISDNTKAKDFGWEPNTSLEIGLDKTIEWILNNIEFIKRLIKYESNNCYNLYS